MLEYVPKWARKMVKGVEGMTLVRLLNRRLSHELIAINNFLMMRSRDRGADRFLWSLVEGHKGMLELNQGISG